MKKNLAPLFAIAFVVAIVCTAVFYVLVAGKISGSAEANSARTIVVAARDLSRGTALAAADLKEIRWNAPAVPPGSYSSSAQLQGYVALRDIAVNQPLADPLVASAKTGGGLGIPSGMRAITVQVGDSSGILSLLKPGHRVDVQAVYYASTPKEAELRVVLQDVEVLKVPPSQEPSHAKSPPAMVTLLTTPEGAAAVGLADAVARIRLVLRNPLDREKTTSARPPGTASVAEPRASVAEPRASASGPEYKDRSNKK